MINEILLRNRE